MPASIRAIEASRADACETPAFPSLPLRILALAAMGTAPFIVRQGLLLRERTTVPSAVQRRPDEEPAPGGASPAEHERRALDERRMIQASRSAAVGELAASVAHQVNNALTGVLGYAELLLADGALEPGPRGDVETIRDEALRARTIIGALRDFAVPGEPELAPTDLSDLVRRTVDLLRHGLEQRGITIHETLPSLPPILLDAQAIQLALLNVVANASQAMATAGHLDLTVDEDADGPVVTIRDDGVGMDEATLGAALAPFASRSVDEGSGARSGLGLSISNRLIQRHRGTIQIQSAPGLGTTVEIHLPRLAADSAKGEREGGEIG